MKSLDTACTTRNQQFPWGGSSKGTDSVPIKYCPTHSFESFAFDQADMDGRLFVIAVLLDPKVTLAHPPLIMAGSMPRQRVLEEREADKGPNLGKAAI